MQAQALQIRARCAEVIEKAKALYGMDLSKVRISFDLVGKSAGRAGGTMFRGTGDKYWVKFNRDMLGREAFDHVLNNTVPHEFAHVVCFMNPDLGKGHDYGWEKVCRALGGTGAQFHKEEVVYGKGLTYEYTTSTGHKVRLSQQRHNKVMRGAVLTYRNGVGRVDKNSPHSIVGQSGHTLVKPVVRVAATKEVPVQAIIATPVIKAHVPQAGLSVVATAKAIMLSAHTAGRGYAEIVRAIVFATQCEQEHAEDIYWANAEKLGLPPAPEEYTE
jgi:predicted SprT family Zn-dependent metalloprotease